MWRHILMVTCGLALIGCDGEADTDGLPDGQDPEYPSEFTAGKYRVTSFSLMAEDSGFDFDGDSTLDNNLPKALNVVDTLLKDDDMSPAGFNTRIAEAIASHDMNVLLESAYATGALRIDLLAGSWDAETLLLSVDPGSYDEQGKALSQLQGEFLDATSFTTEPTSANLPVTFLPDQPPSAVPLERAQMWGTMTDEGVEGVVVGVIPGLRLADDVLVDLIPEEGYGNFTKEQLVNMLRTMAVQEAIADIDLGNDERGISAAFEFKAEPDTW